jgi:hypothetical protein
MSKLNWLHSGKATTGAEQSSRGGRTVGVLCIGALLAATLVGVGCSKSDSKSAGSNGNSASQTGSSQVSSGPVVASSLGSTSMGSVNTQPAAPEKKVIKKRPSVVTYNDRANGISFRYPRRYALKTGENVKVTVAPEESVPMNFVQPGGTALAAVELPKSSYPDTDFTGAFFHVSVNKSLTEAECDQFAFPKPPENAPVAGNKVKLGEMEMSEIEDISGEGMPQADVKYYHLFNPSGCYEFALGLGTSGKETEDGVTPVDREKVFQRLETILTSVKIKEETTPEVVASQPVQPTVETPVK